MSRKEMGNRYKKTIDMFTELENKKTDLINQLKEAGAFSNTKFAVDMLYSTMDELYSLVAGLAPELKVISEGMSETRAMETSIRSLSGRVNALEQAVFETDESPEDESEGGVDGV